ncbi:hypothetical protein M441DRAFT_56297 [Trichoderma asperellum CBS 433.97]|uniref:Uncharacterized protein n=1 Tax=Trichoderma asperellum (strain ATCC 204424 / CBS 433.97 / NBRC 101777) TaxID=1042311 RepID=A0A2T3ZEN6_TRIA4|nr:hypothetical protein M441DRAFT_56297 [Trichoderma asperellum CBS 433.97]PTB43271.1 hypothetical protein M441DRAFT_56297 [Trichoderma asperellum CBS 433.97]
MPCLGKVTQGPAGVGALACGQIGPQLTPKWWAVFRPLGRHGMDDGSRNEQD